MAQIKHGKTHTPDQMRSRKMTGGASPQRDPGHSGQVGKTHSPEQMRAKKMTRDNPNDSPAKERAERAKGIPT